MLMKTITNLLKEREHRMVEGAHSSGTSALPIKVGIKLEWKKNYVFIYSLPTSINLHRDVETAETFVRFDA